MAKSISATGSDDGWEFIFRPWITLRNGKRLYAWQKGLKVFKIRIRKKRNP